MCQPRCPSSYHFPLPMKKQKPQEAKSRSILRHQDLNQSLPALGGLVYAHIHSCRFVCPYAYGRQMRLLNVLFNHSPLYSFETKSLTEPRTRLVANKPQRSSCLCPAQLQGYKHSNSVSHARTASPLTHRPTSPVLNQTFYVPQAQTCHHCSTCAQSACVVG